MGFQEEGIRCTSTFLSSSHIYFVSMDKKKADWTFLQLPRTIFSVQDELPTWPSDSDDSVCLESVSDPDDMDLDDEVDNDDVAVGDNDDEEEEEEEGEVVELDVEGPAAAGEEEADSDKFFDTCSRSASTSSASAGSTRHQHRRLKSDDVDTEDDPVDPVTPGPNSRFDIGVPSSRKGGRKEAKDADEYRGFEDDEDHGSGDDIEDDWVDPSLPSPTSASRPGSLQKQSLPPPVPRKDHVSPSISSPSSSSPSVLAAPPISRSKSSSSKKSSSTLNNSTKGKKNKKQVPVPVPQVKLVNQQQPKEHYPFPVTPADDPSPLRAACQDRGDCTSSVHSSTGIVTEKRMHTARARDGGRTQSGGVKGILPDD